MERFARLYAQLDASTATGDKVAALRCYFAEAPPEDAAWGAYFLSGGKPRQVVPTGMLRELACRVAGIDDWLFQECYSAVGDLAETIALVLPPPEQATTAIGLADWVEHRLLPLRGLPPIEQAERIAGQWRELDAPGRFLLSKLIGGAFRVGVSKLLVQRALAEHAGLDSKQVAQRMMGYTDIRTSPTAERFMRLISGEAQPQADAGQPYPFFLAHQLDHPLERFDEALGEPSDWLIEWKYDGIRAQIVKRAGMVWVWSRGEELITERFPEVVALAAVLPNGTVLDGEIVVWKEGRPAAFALLQQRIGRKTLTKKVLADAPANFIAYDILEWAGEDRRGLPQFERRALLEQVVASTGFALSPLASVDQLAGVDAVVEPSPLPSLEGAAGDALKRRAGASNASAVVGMVPGWPAFATLREESRERGVEGFMLKHRDAAYGTGRTKAQGTWWKWKIEPYSVDAVLVYAQRGSGRRASIYTDYTFAVWNRMPADAAEAQAVVDAIGRKEPAQPGALQLVVFAKAYSGLTDAEFNRIDKVIRANTLEKFGPVRTVKPTLVFELGFEGINRSSRHKSGIAVRFPRMLRIRDDKPLHEADTIGTLEALLAL